MKTLPGLVCLVSLLPLGGFAAPIAVSGPRSSYIAAGSDGFMIGTTRVFDFSVKPVDSDATAILPDNITVNPLDVPGNPGLEFVINRTATSDSLLEVRIAYSVMDFGLQAATVSLQGATASGDAAVSVFEDVIPAGNFLNTLAVFAVMDEQDLSDTYTFTPTGSLTVLNDVAIDGFNGTASLNRFRNTFIPEPGSVLLLAVGSVFLGLRRSNRSKATISA